MSYVLTTVLVLVAELAGVAILTGLLALYWNAMTKNKKEDSVVETKSLHKAA